MPTTSLGITYPCSTDLINLATLQSFANSTDTAINSANQLGNLARLANFARVRNVLGQTFAVAVSTPTTYDTEAFDRGGFFTSGAPTLLTLPANGTYLYTTHVVVQSNPATYTSLRLAVLVNGVEFAYHKEQCNTSPNVSRDFGLSVLLPARVAGDVVTLNQLFTGAGNGTTTMNTSIIQVANV